MLCWGPKFPMRAGETLRSLQAAKQFYEHKKYGELFFFHLSISEAVTIPHLFHHNRHDLLLIDFVLLWGRVIVEEFT